MMSMVLASQGCLTFLPRQPALRASTRFSPFHKGHGLGQSTSAHMLQEYRMAPPTRKLVQKVAHAAHGHDHIHTKIVPKELVLATISGIFAASFWKMHHLNERRKIEEFYSRLEAEEISVLADD